MKKKKKNDAICFQNGYLSLKQSVVLRSVVVDLLLIVAPIVLWRFVYGPCLGRVVLRGVSSFYF